MHREGAHRGGEARHREGALQLRRELLAQRVEERIHLERERAEQQQRVRDAAEQAQEVVGGAPGQDEDAREG